VRGPRGAIAALVLASVGLSSPARADDKPKYRPLGVALVEPAALFGGSDTVIIGPSVNIIYGRHRAVYGVELGLVNIVDRAVGPLQIGVFANAGDGRCVGICAAGLINLHGGLIGVQASIFGNEAGSVPFGVQAGLFNVVREDADFALQIGLLNFNNRRLADIMAAFGAKEGDVVTMHIHGGTQRGIQLGVANGSDDYRGFQLGLFNIAKRGKGIQVSGFNISERYSGVQVGAWNHATHMHGLQLGLVNTARVLEGVQIGAINVATHNKLPVTILVNAGF